MANNFNIPKDPAPGVTSAQILVVDDDTQMHEIFKLRLGREGHGIDCVLGGQEALTAVQFKKYDLIFIDKAMPGMDGVEACKAIKKVSPDSVLIFMTGNFGKDNIVKEKQFVDAGGKTYFLYKPFGKTELQEVVRKALSEKNR